MASPLPPASSLPHALYRAAQVQAFDRLAMEFFAIPGAELMERAGRAAFAVLRERWPQARHISVVTGTGNNGGDGFVVARLAQEAGLRVCVLQLGERESISGDARLNAERWQALPGDWTSFAGLPERTDIIVDAVFGTGLTRQVSGEWAEAIAAINRHAAPVLALDVPSGLDADSGRELGVAVVAAATISFIGLKRGLFTGRGRDYGGDVVFAGLDVPARVYASQILAARRIDWAQQATRLAPRPRSAHKGSFGHVLVVGGDSGFAGAARLAGEAALRSGAGLVSLATRREHVASITATRPELMCHATEATGSLEPLLDRASVVALGPGLGRGDWGRALWERLRAVRQPLVVDADALYWLAQAGECQRDDWILTPHPGEAARLLRISAAEVEADRFAAAERLQSRFGGVVVLKGAGSIVSAGGPRPPAVCSDGNPGLASGGTGDVLTGIIAGLLAQGLESESAAEVGVCLHAAAADRVAAELGESGMLAGDLFPWLPRLLQQR